MQPEHFYRETKSFLKIVLSGRMTPRGIPLRYLGAPRLKRCILGAREAGSRSLNAVYIFKRRIDTKSDRLLVYRGTYPSSWNFSTVGGLRALFCERRYEHPLPPPAYTGL